MVRDICHTFKQIDSSLIQVSNPKLNFQTTLIHQVKTSPVEKGVNPFLEYRYFFWIFPG